MIVCLGPAGMNFSEIAYQQLAERLGLPLIDGRNMTYVADNRAVIPTLCEVGGGHAVLAIETTAGGRINSSLETLAFSDTGCLGSMIYVNAALQLPVNFALLGIHGATLPNIKRVFGHERAIQACSEFICRKSISSEPRNSNGAGVVEILQLGEQTVGALAPISAQGEHGDKLVVLHPAIPSAKSKTLFLALSTMPDITCPDSREYGAISIFNVDDRIGSLAGILGIFKERRINLSYLHSIGRGDGKYRFCLMIRCRNTQLPQLKNALEVVAEYAATANSYGPFPIYKSEISA